MPIEANLIEALQTIDPEKGTALKTFEHGIAYELQKQRLVKLISDADGGTLILSGLGKVALREADTVPSTSDPTQGDEQLGGDSGDEDDEDDDLEDDDDDDDDDDDED